MKYFILSIISVFYFTSAFAYEFPENRRVPAEWEAQKAIWMLWPTDHNEKITNSLIKIIAIAQTYEPVNIIINNEQDKIKAQKFLLHNAVAEENISWIELPIGGNYWLRDNGPIYVSSDETTWLQNWNFNNAGAEVSQELKNDNRISKKIAKQINLRFEDYTDYMLEPDNLEVNGDDTAILNWTLQKAKEPKMKISEHEELLKKALGLKQIIWAYQHRDANLASPITQIVRFTSKRTAVVKSSVGIMYETEESVAKSLKNLGFKVIRYPGKVDWIIGNGFVLAAKTNTKKDQILEHKLQSIWPKHNIHLIDVKELYTLGGGLHQLVSNQPQ